MSELIGGTSPIYDLKIYKQITPIILISIGSLYISILLFRYIKWRQHKHKAKQMRIDRRKLERFWIKRVAHLNSLQRNKIQKPIHSYYKYKIPQSFDSNATLVVSGEGNSHNNQFISSSSEVKQERSNYNSHFKENKSKKRKLIDLIKNRIDGNYQRKKRRQLLWQWSVSMGYCRYNHAYHLNLMIDRLLENKPDNNNYE